MGATVYGLRHKASYGGFVLLPDYAEKIRALRAKAADKAVTPEESALLTAKANELEAKYGNVNSPFTDYTTTKPRPNMADEAVRKFWDDLLGDLLRNQYKWNDKYYDKNGKPRYTEADEDDLYKEQYKYEERDYDVIEEDY